MTVLVHRAPTFCMVMRVANVRMLMEEDQADHIDQEPKNCDQKEMIRLYILRLVNPFDALTEHIECHKDQENSVEQSRDHLNSVVSISENAVSLPH